MTDSTQSKAGSRNPFRYREYFLDEETGLYYLNSRYYDPVVGRFISADDLKVLDLNQEHMIEYNFYAYCLNNPVNAIDSEGVYAILLQIIVGMALGVAFEAVGEITQEDHKINPKKLLVAAVGGAVSASGCGKIVQSIVGGTVSVISDTIDNKNMTISDKILSFTVGAAFNYSDGADVGRTVHKWTQANKISKSLRKTIKSISKDTRKVVRKYLRKNSKNRKKAIRKLVRSYTSYTWCTVGAGLSKYAVRKYKKRGH
ncbi:MAG: RHS repeat-associated core domain-containing protein [Lachnospiraceae bacterium]|nr:RHS repeat-associated core domain-containing protein [Lachnospiraceae bacterium]MDD3615248.1 RHS repeat-associated core domain-containing protein [Lachnospiraceae bacterium]